MCAKSRLSGMNSQLGEKTNTEHILFTFLFPLFIHLLLYIAVAMVIRFQIINIYTCHWLSDMFYRIITCYVVWNCVTSGSMVKRNNTQTCTRTSHRIHAICTKRRSIADCVLVCFCYIMVVGATAMPVHRPRPTKHTHAQRTRLQWRVHCDAVL